MVIDQLEIDPSRLKAGGACLTCKTPLAPKLEKELGKAYYADPYLEVHAKIPKDAEMKSTNVFFPWQGSKPEGISVENIIKVIRSDPAYLEWKQNVTGFKVGFVRHPEYEFFTYNSVHQKANVACADCHMPYTRVGANKISDHNVMSPLKNEMKACQQCHTESATWLGEQVWAIQDRTVSLMNRAGYATAVAAKLLEMAHKAQAENSIGFHNPSEAGRICGDAVAMAGKSEALLRQALVGAGAAVPADINLEMARYLSDRGNKKLKFRPDFEFKDPYHNQDLLTPVSSLGR